MQAHKKFVEKTAHYYTLGTVGPQIERFWIATHGYGQLASRFIQQFGLVDTSKNFILAPEGLHRFYWEGFTGEVVASWMTKEDRLDDIRDYTTYLQQLYDEYLPQLPKEVEIILFGFSQGCATQCRWINACQPPFHQLVLWGGTLPEDIDYAPLLPYLRHKKQYFIYGTQDQFLTMNNRIERHLDFAEKQGFDLVVRTYEGKHHPRKTDIKAFVDWLPNGNA